MPSNGSQMKRLFRTMLVTGSAFTVNYLINLFLTPFITSNVGTGLTATYLSPRIWRSMQPSSRWRSIPLPPDTLPSPITTGT